MSVFTFAHSGTDEFTLMLDRFRANVSDASPAFERMADHQATVWRRNFNSEGSYNSGGWSPLSADYGAWKAKNYPGKRILELTGDLKDSLTSRPFGVDEITDTKMIIGTAVDYAKYHQQGTANMPARPPIGQTTRDDTKEFAKMLHEHIFETQGT